MCRRIPLIGAHSPEIGAKGRARRKEMGSRQGLTDHCSISRCLRVPCEEIPTQNILSWSLAVRHPVAEWGNPDDVDDSARHAEVRFDEAASHSYRVRVRRSLRL